MQRHMLAGTFFSIGLNDQDVRFSLLGNKQTDELEFSVSTGNFIHEAERTQWTLDSGKICKITPPQVMV